MKNDATLLLEDGTFFEGRMFGSRSESYGEVVFTTSMTGYEESISDPSYRGQILVFTYPLIGNYTFSESDLQSAGAQVRGIVVSENTSVVKGGGSALERLLIDSGLPGIEVAETRSIVRRVRQNGTMKGMIIPSPPSDVDIGTRVSELSRLKNTWEENLVSEVSTRSMVGPLGKGKSIAVIDFGIKRNLIRDLSRMFTVHVLPYSSTLDEIMSLKPEGLVLSSGPGDPAHPDIVQKSLPTIRKAAEEMPVLGVCLGHQVISLAFGAKTFKLKFGHRGINHPVRLGERVYITSQNHGFSVLPESLHGTPLNPSQLSLNDGTLEGLEHESGRLITTQYHPEGGPGPQDTTFVYEHFRKLVEGGRR